MEYILPRMKELNENQNSAFIEKIILLILKEQKVSLSQARTLFNDILNEIEDNNIINL